MFTGIVIAIGKVLGKTNLQGDVRLKISSGKMSLTDTKIGDSIAINGVCLTVIELGEDYFIVDVSTETLALTSLANIEINSPVNLEKALLPTSRLGGHIVSGHIDGMAKVITIEPSARATNIDFTTNNDISKYIVKKGSVCVDGVSLTVNNVEANIFSVCIIPHTMQETIFNSYKPGSEVNIEVDMIARYVEKIVQH